jgi:ribokinase
VLGDYFLNTIYESYNNNNDTCKSSVTFEYVFSLQGAGDMFVGSLAFYLAYYPELPMREIVKRSCEVATVSVQNYGTQTSFPKRHDLPTELFM